MSGGLSGALTATIIAATIKNKNCMYKYNLAGNVYFSLYGACISNLVAQLTNWLPKKLHDTEEIFSDGAVMQKMLDRYPSVQKYYKPLAIGATTGLSALSLYLTLPDEVKRKLSQSLIQLNQTLPRLEMKNKS